MEIELEAMDAERWPAPEGWTVVGRIGRNALAYDPERQAHLLGDGEPVPLDRAEVNAALEPAIDRAASKLWPGGWTYAFEEVFGIKRRNLAAERLARQGMPPSVLLVLANAASEPDAEVLGGLILAIARYADAAPGIDEAERLSMAVDAAKHASDVVRAARRGKPAWPRQLKVWLGDPD
ncbi:hypothetical protein SAMN02799631_00273 [Methylobacterium sp. 174MFSha1.1]|uniref:hypothetical protein n=1 Tax=Methylobacterium sp. 174MFSha1.1 TaxID=1502749 RepID=UPI0008F39242|nr:hypothetical protein [Methylobacterium sp. 174MFSha1.1]SFU34740.1 hypothetical protein SAMN02799631_00273 [Methylobacterium sp. 174MFSha1.1]